MSTSSSLPFTGGKCVHVSLDEIRDGTDNFDERYVLGKGGEGKVYLGKVKLVPDLEITQVAVKHLKPNSEEFEQEIMIISKIQHPNLVSLLGYCDESGEKILICEFMENGNLSNYVKEKSRISLSWQQRVRICLDAARGLQHLHAETDEFPKGIIHRDVKPENILISQDWVAKISDFGMFKVSDVGQTKSTMNTNLKGTSGYYAPEYIAYRHVTRKIDVYAFGVVLFQVLCLKTPWDRGDESYYGTDGEDLGLWAQENVDPKIKEEITDDSLKKFTSIIRKCLKKDPSKRPTMDSVVLELDKVLSLTCKEGDDEAKQDQASTDSETGFCEIEGKTGVGFLEKFTSIIKKCLRKVMGKHPTITMDGVVVGQEKAPKLKREEGDDKAKQDRGPTKLDSQSTGLHFLSHRYAFTFEDLCGADSEVLSKGRFGTSYKAIFTDGTSVVVKRLNEVSVGEREFEEQMEILGRIKHENVVELIAYYYSKGEHLTVCDYYSSGSVAAMLHGIKVSGKRKKAKPLMWEIRFRIAIGVSRGLARIHAENGGKLVHRNIKSSNIFLNPQQYGCISDIGLSTTVFQVESSIPRAARAYWAPEVSDTIEATQSSDVYSFGVLLLELLTGKSPEVIDLVSWVNLQVAGEEWTEKVFDVVLRYYSDREEEMVEILQIAMSCVTNMADQRPKMAQVVRLIEKISHVEPVAIFGSRILS